MREADKTKKQLVAELAEVRRRVSELEKLEAEHKRLEEALREGEERYRAVFENTGTATAIIEADYTISLVNSEFARLSGYSKDELEGKRSWVELLTKRDLTRLRRYHRQRRRNPDAVPKRYEFQFHDKAGNIKDGLMTVDMIPGTKRSVCSILDITERKRAEEREIQLLHELHMSNRLAAIGRLAAGVAHEINNPLTGVLGYCERLIRKSRDKALARDLEKIRDSAKRIARVTGNLLAFSRQDKPRKEPVDISRVLQESLELSVYGVTQGGVKVVLDLAPRLPVVMGDFQRLQQVFLNLILNAEQVMAETRRGNKLTIKTELAGDFVRVSFCDDGPGIPAENVDKLFEPFFTTRGRKDGTGLGLSICHGIIAEHGGRMYVKSLAGKGATFFVELPVGEEKTG